jgi:F-type H+-transporting ATPase subunit gamma
MMAALAQGAASNPNAPKLLVGTGADKRHLIVAVTADRGIAGPVYASSSRAAKARVRALQAEGKTVQLFAVGRKGRDSFRRDMADIMMGDVNFVGRKTVEFKDAEAIADRIIAAFNDGQFYF